MRISVKILTAALIAAAALALAGGPASARNRIERIDARSSESAGGVFSLAVEGIQFICDVTLNMTAARLIQKTRGTLAGSVTTTRGANCRDSTEGGRGGTITWLIPLMIAYNSITGTLPSITGVLLLVIGGFLIEERIIFGYYLCLYAGTIGIDRAENPSTRYTIQAGTRVTLVEDLLGMEGLPCMRTAEPRGLFTHAGSTTIALLETR